ncbi:MAG: hypothetical protein L0F96_10655 [Lactococcus lactis]|nr:hypothetical protein [Lactococcus lactis]
MTFEEAIEIIEDECRVEAEDGFSAKEKDLDTFLALSIIKNLQETYAPKIKMTKKESDMLKRLKRVPQTGVGIVDYNRREPKVLLSNESKFVDAWLHPELIEVVDE